MRVEAPLGALLAIRILVVDDSRRVRQAVRACIEQDNDWEICGEAEDGETAIAMAIALKPELVILDLSLPDISGLVVAESISRIVPGLPIILFTMLDCTDLLRASAKAVGIRHVFSKSEGFGQQMLDAIHSLLPPPDTAASLVG